MPALTPRSSQALARSLAIRSRVLGPHDDGDRSRAARLPAGRRRRWRSCRAMTARCSATLQPARADGLFERRCSTAATPYRLRIQLAGGGAGDRGPLYASACCSATSTSTCSAKGGIANWPTRSARMPMTVDGVDGVRFAVWAPNARARLRGRRLQRLGRRAGIRCGCAMAPASGSCSSRGSAPGAALQIRDRRTATAACCR